MSLTIAYVTSRQQPHFEWFADSLRNELAGTRKIEQLVLIDPRVVGEYLRAIDINPVADSVIVGPPKPNVWNGPHRLTSVDWFAMASARNTAICLCRSTHIAFVDDLSVLLPGWLNAALEAVNAGYIGLGAYKKVANLVVENGIVKSFDEVEGGTDDRLSRVTNDVSECDGGWLYGCSLVAPLEDLLEVGGFPEICDGLGSEDYCLGIALRNAGKHLKYDRRMMTLESHELHFVEPAMRRTDKGVSPNDKSHAVLRIAQQSKYFPNFYDGGIRALRDHIQRGGNFPIVQVPQHDWYDGQAISEMI